MTILIIILNTYVKCDLLLEILSVIYKMNLVSYINSSNTSQFLLKNG